MRIACPSCNAVYQVPDEQLGEGRVVRCVRCGTDWSPVVAVPVDGKAGRPAEMLPEPALEAAAEPVEEPEPEPEPEPVRRMALDEDAVATVVPAEAPAAVTPAVVGRRRSPWLAIAWVASVLTVGGGIAAAVVWRDWVMQGWPPSIRAYVAAGLASRP